ncbi:MULTISPECIES: lysozyme inhibitor LprI family protein [unclassified Bradyrhizobium]|uniref:lysozyme inhibitor LprI family protein n=1 Tax=unclassified Bradyrhizobium TaxID=2631580 RepID=UPI00291613BB|nr:MULTISPECIES: lysozyme inhibitor LprI family protein [unclassified Bradyrhizobium]
MSQFLTDRWNDILALNSSQWLVIALLSVTVGTALFYLFNWLYSQRFQAQSDVIGLQKLHLELYAGQHQSAALPAPTDKTATLILPSEWEPFLDQPMWYLKTELDAWQGGQQGANRNSADLGFVQDAKLFQIYVRLYERLAPDKHEDFRKEQENWLGKRRTMAEAAVKSHGGSLAPLEFNLEFIEVTAARIKELEQRLSKT